MRNRVAAPAPFLSPMTPLSVAPAVLLRRAAALAAALCVLSLLIAYFYMERYLLLEPCPLCILDRFAVAVMAAGFIALAAGARGGAAWLAWGASSLGLAAGLIFAGRHIWLQNRPPDFAGGCLADNPAAAGFIALIQDAFSADADCGAIAWEFAGLTIPEQVLILFIVLALWQAALFILLRRAAAAASEWAAP